MNLLLFTDADRLSGERIRVTGRRLQHLVAVHKAQAGQTIRLGEVNGKMGRGEILEIDDQQATLAIALTDAAPDKLPIELVLALPRPKMLRRILRSVAEFGVSQLHLINSYRVEKSYWQTPVLETGAIYDYLLQGLEQARDTVLPAVHCHRRFKPFVEDVFPDLIADKDALLAHPGDYQPAPCAVNSNTVVVVGPEGGFIPYEVEKFQGAGCTTISLGPRILRVENAVNALLGRLA